MDKLNESVIRIFDEIEHCGSAEAFADRLQFIECPPDLLEIRETLCAILRGCAVAEKQSEVA